MFTTLYVHCMILRAIDMLQTRVIAKVEFVSFPFTKVPRVLFLLFCICRVLMQFLIQKRGRLHAENSILGYKESKVEFSFFFMSSLCIIILPFLYFL